MIIKPINIILISWIVVITTSQSCQDLQRTQSQFVWQITKLSPFDRFFLLTAGTLSILISLITLTSWFIYKSFSTPSDILFAIVICELGQNLALVVQAGYFTNSDRNAIMPQGFNMQCLWMGILNVWGKVMSTYYNLLFCIVMTYSIGNTLKSRYFNPVRYHLLALLLGIVIIITLIFTDSIGRSLNGICGFRIASRQATARFILQIVVAIICFYLMIKFKRKLPSNEYFQKQSVFGYYYYYMGIYATIEVVSSLSFLISEILCQMNQNSTLLISNLHIFYSISLCTNLILSFAIVILRFSHPILQLRLKKLISKTKLNQSQKQMKQIGDQIIEDDQNDQEKASWLGCLLQSLKGSQILSFIQGVTVAFIEKDKKYTQNSLTMLSYQRNYIFEIDQHIIAGYIDRRISSRESLIVKQKLDGLNSLSYEVVSFCPDVFSSLCTRQQIRQVLRSLHIRKNIKTIKRQSYTNGGKSGEFFFSTFDNRLMLKTIRHEQVQAYLSHLHEFIGHFGSYPSTLITKILGLFQFKRLDINQQPIYIILMYNLSLSPISNNLRVYDIKGSQYNRQSMKENNIENQEDIYQEEKLRKYTLKDKDFQKLQKTVKVDGGSATKLKRILKNDFQFLGNQGFMDYSLLIIKRKGSTSRIQSLSEIHSTAQQGVIYNFGVIDYLESWTLKRKAERAIKTLITSKQVTANSPINYSQRLNQFIQDII